MWPSALQLTRDECRGILRRLELESYSNVISVFRAQGGLSDSKAKLLEELRSIFHISQERHRAEARRVANDEQLSTIAEAISGPNTWQEWSREGRRTYPLLPRVPPQTALSIIANNVAAEITNENNKLPYPTDTVAQQQQQQQQQEFSTSSERTSESVPIVTSDPLQPEIPEIRRNLKRNLPADALATTKKRIMSEMSPSVTANESPLSPSTQIRKLYHNHSKTQSRQRSALAKKVSNSPAKRITAAAKKRLISGDSVDSNKQNNASSTVFQAPSSSSQTLTTSTTVTTALNATVESIPPPLPLLSSQDTVAEPQETTTQATPTTPQIATSKKDISKNLSKLNMITNQPVQQQHQEKLPECKTEKLSTPVQKYIVEERTPMLMSNASTLPSHLLEKQQVITSKVKPMTAVVPTPLSSSSKAKITSVKTIKNADIVCSSPVSSQPQVFNVIDASTPPYVPHTPPAIINISSKFEPEHGKVLTTKLLPLMLSSSSKLESSNGNPGHMKNITHPSPSTATTVFRKPNIIKGSMPMKQKIQITNQQIISPPTVASLKMSPHLHLKGVPGGGPIHNRKSVKIFSSSNGKMFIQSADSSAKQMTKVNTIVTAQKGTGHIVNASPAPGRIAIQKVQIIPAPTTTSAGSLGSKPIAITKPNMIFMPMSSTPTVKGLPIVKGNKFTTVLPTTMAQDSVAGTATAAKSNVFVIGAVQSPPQTILSKDMQGFSNRNNMITEDTPVDIITTPIIVDVDSIDTQSIKPTETIDLTTISDAATPPPSRATVTGTLPSTVLQSRLAPDTCYVESIQAKGRTSGEEMDIDVASDSQTSSSDNVAMVIGVTDWEMELDQEANKARALNAQKTQKSHSSVESILVGSGGEEGGSSDEHFADDDVIEEQEETEEETDDGCETAVRDTAASKREEQQQQSHEANQQHEHRHHHHHVDDDEDEPIEVGDEQMKSEGDVIQYDESYESANDDMDENIAIEYVEDDQDGYDEKIDSTSNDRKETMECNSNIVLIKQSTNLTTDSLESSENKSQSSNDCMVSVEEISSTTQQNIAGSQDEH